MDLHRFQEELQIGIHSKNLLIDPWLILHLLMLPSFVQKYHSKTDFCSFELLLVPPF